MDINRDEADLFLRAFAEAHGIEELNLDENNGAAVEFGEENVLVFEYSEEEQGIVLWSPLFSLAIAESAAAETALLRLLLCQNFPTARLGGAHLALEEDLGIVVMAKKLSVNPASPAQIVTLAEHFIEQVLGIIEQVASMDFENPEHEALALPAKPVFAKV